MTREEARAAIKVMEAYANGKKIQRTDLDGNWFDCENPNFDWASFNYRIKPEPKYRPFRTQEECWEEMHKHSDFGWLKSKGTGSVGLIGTLYEKDKVLMMIWATNENISFSASDVFNDYVFTDNAPFGIKEE